LPEDVVEEDAPPASRKRRQRGFSDTLLGERIELTFSDEEKVGASQTFFNKIKEELQFIPAQLKVLEYWQEKAVFEQDGEERILAATRPVHPLGKCTATTSLLAYIITSKYADGYSGYGKVCRDNDITRVGCWDHARRKFVEATKAAKPQVKGKPTNAS
jgi:transposase